MLIPAPCCKSLGIASGLRPAVLCCGRPRAWRWSSPPLPLSEKSSIAVLPFDNIGTDPKWDRFADGITEDIITDLSHSKDLVVIARNSTEVYKGKPIDIRQIGRDLNVKYVLEGSIQSMGDQIRVTAQLIEAASGSHVWSERYDRPADDLFAVQNDVTQRIAATLSGYEGAVAEAERTSSQAQAAREPICLRHLLAGHGGETQGDQGKLDRSRRPVPQSSPTRSAIGTRLRRSGRLSNPI